MFDQLTPPSPATAMQISDDMHERFSTQYPAPKDSDRDESRHNDGSPLRGSTALHTTLLAASRLKRALQQGTAEILDSAELSVLQWLVLCHLRQTDGTTLTELATALRYDASALSRAVHPLQQRRLVIAMRTPWDRRVIQLSISQNGRTLCSALGTTLDERLNQTLEADLGPQAMQALLQLMEQATASLDSLRPGGESTTVAREASCGGRV